MLRDVRKTQRSEGNLVFSPFKVGERVLMEHCRERSSSEGTQSAVCVSAARLARVIEKPEHEKTCKRWTRHHRLRTRCQLTLGLFYHWSIPPASLRLCHFICDLLRNSLHEH